MAGQLAPASVLIDIPALEQACHANQPVPGDPRQRVAFGTSGHRGTSLDSSLAEAHILAITQAICD
jgi:phosphoglucomutase